MRLLKGEVEPPPVVWAPVPVKATVPLLCVKVPLLLQFPVIFIVAEVGPVSVPVMVMLLKVLAPEPLMVVVPSKITVPVFGVKVPLLTKLAETVNELEPLTVTVAPFSIVMLLQKAAAMITG